MSGFHSSPKQSETFINYGGKKPEEGRCQEIKPCLVGREVKCNWLEVTAWVNLDVELKSLTVSLLAGAAPCFINI